MKHTPGKLSVTLDGRLVSADTGTLLLLPFSPASNLDADQMPEAASNLHEIVKRWNAHDEIVAALIAIKAWCSLPENWHPNIKDKCTKALKGIEP